MTQEDAGCEKFYQQNMRQVRGFFTFLLAFFFCISTNPVHAAKGGGGGSGHNAGFGIGQSLLMGDFSKYFSDSISYHLIYGFNASPLFGLLTNITFNDHANANESNTLSMKGITPNLKINLAYVDVLVVYAFSGFGLFLVEEKIGEVQGSVTVLGFDLGAGVDLALHPKFNFGTSMSFHNIFNKTDPTTITSANPTGLNIGGTFFRLFLNLQYVF